MVGDEELGWSGIAEMNVGDEALLYLRCGEAKRRNEGLGPE